MQVVSMHMTPDPVVLDVDDTLDHALTVMEAHSVRHLPVLEGDQLTGVVSDRDLLSATGWLPARVHACRGPDCSPESKHIRDIMQTPVFTIEPDDSLVSASIQFLERGVGCLPVKSADKLIGLVTEMDLLRAYTHDCNGTGWSSPIPDPPAGEKMSRDPLTIQWFTTLEDALALCRSNGLRHLPVLEAGLLVGMVSDRDLRRAQGAGRADDTSVDEFMTREVVSAPPEAALSEIASSMVQHGFSAVPITEADVLLGILTTTDVLEHCLDAYRSEHTGLAK